jgi:hypothetical protein
MKARSEQTTSKESHEKKNVSSSLKKQRDERPE